MSQQNRKLPPLPGPKRMAARIESRKLKEAREPKASSVTEAAREPQVSSVTAAPREPKAFVTEAPREPKASFVTEAPREPKVSSVTEVLEREPQLLEDYVVARISVEQLKRWLDKKDPSVLASPAPAGVPTQDLSKPLEPSPPSVEKPKLRFITRAALAPRERLMTEALNVSTRFLDADVLPLVKNVTNDAIDFENNCKFICEVSVVLAIALRADKYYMWSVSPDGDKLNVCCPEANSVTKTAEDIKTGTSIVCQAARTREIVIREELVTSDVPVDPTSEEGRRVKSQLCLPIIRLDGELTGCMEFQRFYCSPAFTDDHFQVASAVVCWVGGFLGILKISSGAVKQVQLNDFLLQVSRVIFDDIISTDSLVSRIMMFAKDLVSASRCSFFLVDEEEEELYADFFDEGLLDEDGKPKFVKREQIRFPKSKGIAGLVATTGEVVNIKNAYADNRFNRDIDIKTGFQTKNILCMPIISKGKVMGVVQMINRSSGEYFTDEDESSFRTFAVYCALALHYSKMYSSLKHQQIMNSVALEQLSYHIQATDEETNSLLNDEPPPLPADFKQCTFYSKGYEVEMPAFVVEMAKNLFGENSPAPRFDMLKLSHFVLTVKKNYRPVVYHNWRHAFTVAHCMYWILRQISGTFTKLEEQALFIGCLCHDLDHRGFSNSFMQKLDQPLAGLYSTSVMEQHHYNMTVTILQQKDHDIFSHLSTDQYKEMLEQIRLSIIATDLAQYFGKQKELSVLIQNKSFEYTNQEHKDILKAILMTGCDLCAVCKPWETQQETVRYIYAEFYAQGDEEKKLGFKPIPLMDRDNLKNIPNDQVGFLKFVCMPGYKNLYELYPDTEIKDMYARCGDNCEKWEKIVEENKNEDGAGWTIDIPTVN